MAYLIDTLIKTHRSIAGSWWIARPDVPPLSIRLRDAIEVLRGNADAVQFREQFGEFDNEIADILRLEKSA